MAIVLTNHIWFRMGEEYSSVVVGACTMTGNMRIENGPLGIEFGTSVEDFVSIADEIETLDGEMQKASMAVVAAYVDEAYERHEMAQDMQYERESAVDDFLRTIAFPAR